MSSPLVLAVPTFNCAAFVRETLGSLNSQGDQLRWWLQDGGSADGTVEIARSMARVGDTVLSEPDSGQADALNRAMSRMGGEIIGFINGDDCLLPGVAEVVLDFFQRHPEIDLVCGGIEWMNAQGTVTGTHRGRINSLTEALDIYHVWWKRRQWVQPEVFFRRSLWERAGGFDPSWPLVFDYEFWVRCFIAGARVAHIETPLARFRIHPGQKSAAAERAADEIRGVVQQYLNAGVAIPPTVRRRITAELSYDLYQSGKSAPHLARPGFVRALIRNPAWLMCAPVRARIANSLRSRIPRRLK